MRVLVGQQSMDPSPEGKSLEDAELMAAMATGNLAALGTLYDRYHEEVRRFVLRTTTRPSEADDIVHEAFLALQRAAGRYDGRPSALPFLLGVTAQTLRGHRRKHARFLRMLASFAETFLSVVSRTPEDRAGDAQQLATIYDALERLSEEKRVVFLMIEREGLSAEEVAETLGIPLPTVWTRLHYARAELRRRIAKRIRT